MIKLPPLFVLLIFVAIALAASAQVAPAQQAESEDVEIRMTPAAAAQCEAEGGCSVVSRAYIQKLIERAREQSCRNRNKET